MLLKHVIKCIVFESIATFLAKFMNIEGCKKSFSTEKIAGLPGFSIFYVSLYFIPLNGLVIISVVGFEIQEWLF